MSTYLVVNNSSLECYDQPVQGMPYAVVDNKYLPLTTETSVGGTVSLSNSSTTYLPVKVSSYTEEHTDTYTSASSYDLQIGSGTSSSGTTYLTYVGINGTPSQIVYGGGMAGSDTLYWGGIQQPYYTESRNGANYGLYTCAMVAEENPRMLVVTKYGSSTFFSSLFGSQPRNLNYIMAVGTQNTSYTTTRTSINRSHTVTITGWKTTGRSFYRQYQESVIESTDSETYTRATAGYITDSRYISTVLFNYTDWAGRTKQSTLSSTIPPFWLSVSKYTETVSWTDTIIVTQPY